MLLAEFVAHTKSIDTDFLVKSWEAHISDEDQSQRGVRREWEGRVKTVCMCGGKGECWG